MQKIPRRENVRCIGGLLERIAHLARDPFRELGFLEHGHKEQKGFRATAILKHNTALHKNLKWKMLQNCNRSLNGLEDGRETQYLDLFTRKLLPIASLPGVDRIPKSS